MQKNIKPEQMSSLLGQTPGPSSWIQITQEQVNQFADVTRDHQFIHVDPEKAARTRFGGTIVHGFLLLSLLPCLLAEKACLPEGLAVKINYGLDRVRFLQPVPVNSYVRACQEILAVEERQAGMWKVKTQARLEIQGTDKPAMSAELITLFSRG